MSEVTATRRVSDAELEIAVEPRDDLVVEIEVGPGRFDLQDGPFDRWHRTVEEVPGDDESDLHTIVERVDYHLAIPVWHVLFNPLVRRSITRGTAAEHRASTLVVNA